MAWEVTLPDGSKDRTDHLEVGAVIEISRKCNVPWIHVTDHTPAGDGSVMLAVWEHMLDAHGLEKPDGLTMIELAERFEKVEDDRPTEYADGHPQQGDAPKTD